ncbi:MAG: ATP-binding protein [Muribaculaceae bacterium]|nr:ATP-binding protein [Muribaculaceae bacterium]
MESKESEFVVVYGRRRVGKTFLVRSFFEDKFCFTVTGIYNSSTRDQLSNFVAALHQCGAQVNAVPKDWFEAFSLLREHLTTVKTRGKKVIFIDEMPWMDTGRSLFLTAFGHFWNSWAAWQHNIVMIVCGSATAWMSSKILNNTGALYNRATARLHLNPFSLHETEQYLRSMKMRWSRYDIVQCYMAVGGIPYYLRQLDPQLTVNQNIDRLFFGADAILKDEFSNLYRTLFSNGEAYEKLVTVLATKRIGLTRTEIKRDGAFADNGKLTTMLDNLSASGFVRPYNYYGNRKRDTLYQLADYYTLFYLHFSNGKHGQGANYWVQTTDNPSRRAWSGYAYEQVCKDHLWQIKRRLGIAAVLNESSSWFAKAEDNRGAQIDLVIERRDRVINLCEIKFSINQFVIDKDYDLALRNKIETFRRATKSETKTLHLTMITTFGVKRGMYSDIVQSEVTLEDLFVPQED